jgi:hypothetical protein
VATVTRPDVHVCSAKGCRQQAHWALGWNNPRLHTPERRKVWLACTEHRPRLSDFLASRGFLRETTPVDLVADGSVSQEEPGRG